MYGADENARPGYNGPRQAIETCGIAEEMLSDGLLISMTGDPIWAERCENAAFNSYPASMTADLKALRYLTAPNQPQSDHTNKAPGVQNGGPMFHMNPHDHRCCQHNSGHSWPYFTQHLWYAAPGNGLAAYLYAPCEVQAQVADGVTAKIVEETRYPFEEQITFKVSLPKTAAFPLYLRIPAWCDQAQLTLNGESVPATYFRLLPSIIQSTQLTLNGEPVPATLPAGKLAKIERTWQDGDQLVLSLPMQVKRHHVDGQSRHGQRESRTAHVFAADQGGIQTPRRHGRVAGLGYLPRLAVELRPGALGRRPRDVPGRPGGLAGRQSAVLQRRRARCG